MKDALGGVQTVLVLGGTSELALATVNSLDLRPGATVVLAGRDEAALEKAGASLPAQVVVRRWDATDVERHPAFLAEIAAEVGDIDLVLAASGVLGDHLVQPVQHGGQPGHRGRHVQCERPPGRGEGDVTGPCGTEPFEHGEE